MSQSGTVIGGYGQFGVNALRVGSDGRFLACTRTVENAWCCSSRIRSRTTFASTPSSSGKTLACSSCLGSAEVEQAYVQWRLAGDLFALRIGLVLVPMGIINQWHEPPIFNGVERPMVDQLIIPDHLARTRCRLRRQLAAGCSAMSCT